MYDNLLPFHGVPYFLYTKTETGCEICKGHPMIMMIAELRAWDAALDPSFGSAHVGGSFMLAQAAQSKEAQAGPSPVTVAAPGGQPLARMGLPVGRVTNRHLGISKT